MFITLQFYRGFNGDLRGVWPKKSSSKKVEYPKVRLTVLIKQKICKNLYGPPPEHSYDEEQVFIRWVPPKGFPQRKLGVQLSVEVFLTVKQSKTPFKDNMPGNEWFQAFLCSHPQLSTHTSESVTSSSATLGEAVSRTR